MATAETNRTLLEYEVSREQEDNLMIKYTKVFTRGLVFAVDLMAFFMEKSDLKFQNYIYPNCLGRRAPSDFNDQVQRFVEVSITRTVQTTDMSCLLYTMGASINLYDTNYAEFKCFANAAATKHQEGEYEGYTFLMFCVMMANMCSVAFSRGITYAPDFGIMLLCRTYRNFLIKSALPANPWRKIKTSAVEMAQVLEFSWN